MKKLVILIAVFCSVSLLLIACGNGTDKEAKKENQTEKDSSEKENDRNSDAELKTDESVPEESEKAPKKENEKPKNKHNSKENNALADYSSEEIEYARVWLQLGANQDLNALEVQHITAGTQLNPEDEINVRYPEGVIQLRGSRLVDGIVTYSGNGDGTINVYNVPDRWYGGMAPPEDIDKQKVRKQMEDIIKDTKLVSIDPGDDQEVINLIELLNVDR